MDFLFFLVERFDLPLLLLILAGAKWGDVGGSGKGFWGRLVNFDSPLSDTNDQEEEEELTEESTVDVLVFRGVLTTPAVAVPVPLRDTVEDSW